LTDEDNVACSSDILKFYNKISIHLSEDTSCLVSIVSLDIHILPLNLKAVKEDSDLN